MYLKQEAMNLRSWFTSNFENALDLTAEKCLGIDSFHVDVFPDSTAGHGPVLIPQGLFVT